MRVSPFQYRLSNEEIFRLTWCQHARLLSTPVFKVYWVTVREETSLCIA